MTVETIEPILPLYIDSTMTTCARSCLRKFRNEFVWGLRPESISIDLHAGACFASALETVYEAVWSENLALPQAMDKAHAAFMLQWGDFEIPEYKRTAKTKDRMWEAVESYFERYSPKTDHVQPYFNAATGKPTFEFTFAIPLEPTVNTDVNSIGDKVRDRYTDYNPSNHDGFPLHPSGQPFMYCGRFDMLGQVSGRPVVRDEKTTGSSIGQLWAQQWKLRNQFMGYKWACNTVGLDVQEVVVRGIAIQKTQIVHAEATETYSNALIAKWYEQLRRDLWKIRKAWDENYFDYNFGDACTAYGSCLYVDMCQSPNEDLWAREFTVRRWNPLQKDPTKEAA